MERCTEPSQIREELRQRRQRALNKAADAYERAAETHERAAALFDRLNDPDRAAKHRDASRWDRLRADKARDAADRQ